MRPHSTVEFAHVRTSAQHVPVFVDPVGGRRILVRLGSVLLATALTGITVAVVIAVFGAPTP